MTKLLTADEMLDVLLHIKHPKFNLLKAKMEQLADEIGELIAVSLDVDCGPASFEGSAFAGTCVPFLAKRVGQPCPEPLLQFDQTEWCTQEHDLNPATGAIIQ
jgi:hypothetical protein